MKVQPTLFVVGAGHLYGSEGLVELLEEEGYTIEKATYKPQRYATDYPEVTLELLRAKRSWGEWLKQACLIRFFSYAQEKSLAIDRPEARRPLNVNSYNSYNPFI